MTATLRLSLLLAAMCVLGAVAALPALLHAVRASPAIAAELAANPLPPLPVMLLATAGQALVLFGLAGALGLHLAQRLGCQPRILGALVTGSPLPTGTGATLLAAGSIGVAVGLAAALADQALFMPLLPSLADMPAAPAAARLAAGILYGGINEEVLVRLFLMSALVLLLGRIWRTRDGAPAEAAWWGGLLIAALAFAALHLPLLTQLVEPSPALIVRTLTLNAALGAVFGLLYWRRGIEAAMVAHAAAHLPLQLMA